MSRMLDVDAALVDVLARFRSQPQEELLWVPDTVLVARGTIDVEVLDALCKLDQSGVIQAGGAAALPTLMRGLRVRKYRHDMLLDGR